MNQKQLDEALDAGRVDFDNETLEDVSFEGVCLVGVSFVGAWLGGLNLRHARVIDVNFDDADLVSVDLANADIRNTRFQGARLEVVSLAGAFLTRVDFSDATLEDLNLRGAKLWGRGTALRGSVYNVMDFLRMDFESLSKGLTRELMRWDALVCGEAAMEGWAKKGGPCPFVGCLQERLFQFDEDPNEWRRGLPTMNIMELWQALAKEKGVLL